MIDILCFVLQMIADSRGEFRVCKPVRRPDTYGKKATRKLMLSLCAAFKQRDTMGNTEFDGLIVAGLEMQSRDKFRRTPITPI